MIKDKDFNKLDGTSRAPYTLYVIQIIYYEKPYLLNQNNMLFFHEHAQDVLLCQMYDLQVTWSDIYFRSKQEVQILMQNW